MDSSTFLDAIKRCGSVDEILNLANSSLKSKTLSEQQSKRGNIYEKLWDVVIKLGLCHEFPNSEYEHYQGNVNTLKPKKIKSIQTFLKNIKVFSKGKGGSSDITLKNINNSTWVFISSKYYLNDSNKKIDDYDVEKILAHVQGAPHIYEKFEIYLIVNDKHAVLDIINKSQETNKKIKDNIKGVLDIGNQTNNGTVYFPFI
jgi:hypothetical protein